MIQPNEDLKKKKTDNQGKLRHIFKITGNQLIKQNRAY